MPVGLELEGVLALGHAHEVGCVCREVRGVHHAHPAARVLLLLREVPRLRLPRSGVAVQRPGGEQPHAALEDHEHCLGLRALLVEDGPRGQGAQHEAAGQPLLRDLREHAEGLPGVGLHAVRLHLPHVRGGAVLGRHAQGLAEAGGHPHRGISDELAQIEAVHLGGDLEEVELLLGEDGALHAVRDRARRLSRLALACSSLELPEAGALVQLRNLEPEFLARDRLQLQRRLGIIHPLEDLGHLLIGVRAGAHPHRGVVDPYGDAPLEDHIQALCGIALEAHDAPAGDEAEGAPNSYLGEVLDGYGLEEVELGELLRHPNHALGGALLGVLLQGFEGGNLRRPH
mmetsp:Transcript_57106/g.180753  ORF Transcript_57106/g.180753 Transcript_57106/m.180753 type:complete len:343 (-) Transcript_57106:354-1382(-)